MAAAATPIKVDAQTDQFLSHAAHFLGESKKDVVDAAVREEQLDGTVAGSVSLLTGMSRAELDELGGFADC